ncbi:hypothetical protein JS531_09115 [Bifidobacterium sp. CP2]|uniref:hypothetical protein n=1 Tax=Bifidobacterium sp. CP2 TaxID=2809025 RepID=UPI001BDD4760|nr:hypothetical protein [Bifidobacterium sp. CP2]MBT1182101.1 hypothetical protein [Bifidobacterium sp. CP2]
MKRPHVWGIRSITFGLLALAYDLTGLFARGFALTAGLFGLAAASDQGGRR